MRFALTILMVLLLATPSLASEFSNRLPDRKPTDHVGQNPGMPDGREGGETFEDAVPILELPFHDTGNTSDNIDDYAEMCPYGSWAPDVVYSYIPDEDSTISIDLCLSLYDTAIFVWDIDGQLVACNDDFYMNDPPCGNYTSKIEDVPVMAGETYYITVDGYTNDSGEYVLDVDYDYCPGLCDLICVGFPEGEPPLVDGYIDHYNIGCNDNSGLNPFQALEGDANGELLFCGKTGWYSSEAGTPNRDTDWFTAVIGPTGTIEWIVDGEWETNIFQLGPLDCESVGVLQDLTVGPCQPDVMIIEGIPGEEIWLWVGPSVYNPPSGFSGFEYNYVATFSGLQPGPVATRTATFGSIKSMYR